LHICFKTRQFLAMKAVIYARVSTDEQATNYSLPTQLAACRDYAAAHDMAVVGEFSDDFTGTVPIEHRPEGGKAYELLQSDSADAIIVHRASRLYRPANEGDEFKTPLMIQSLAELKKEIHTCNHGKIETTFSDLLVALFEFKFAGDERRAIMERMIRGKTAMLKAGGLIVTWPPFGYRITGEKRDALEIVEDEAAIVRAIFVWAMRGDDGNGPLSMWQIAKRLTDMHVLTHRDKIGNARHAYKEGTWSPTDVSRLLARAAYVGTYEYDFNGRVYSAQVPQIVSREMYDTAQAMREQNARYSPRNTRGKARYLVAGMIHCGCGCGLAYAGNTNNGRAWYVPMGKSQMQYTPQRCTGVQVPAPEVETAVVDYIKMATRSESFDVYLVEAARNSSGVDERRAELARITQEIEQCSAEAARLVDLVAAGDLVADALAAKSRALDEWHTELIAQRNTTEAEINRLALSDDDVQRYLQLRADISLGLEAATREQMRAILRACGLEIIVKDGAVIISARAFEFIPPSEPIQVRQNVRRRRSSPRQSDRE
jgi:site-specific DNA recombinase